MKKKILDVTLERESVDDDRLTGLCFLTRRWYPVELMCDNRTGVDESLLICWDCATVPRSCRRCWASVDCDHNVESLAEKFTDDATLGQYTLPAAMSAFCLQKDQNLCMMITSPHGASKTIPDYYYCYYYYYYYNIRLMASFPGQPGFF